MNESPTRQILGWITIIASIIIGITMSSFIWGIGSFIVINLTVAPILKLVERNK